MVNKAEDSLQGVVLEVFFFYQFIFDHRVCNFNQNELTLACTRNKTKRNSGLDSKHKDKQRLVQELAYVRPTWYR